VNNKPTKNTQFDPLSLKPYALSRSKLELFMNCPRCFYLCIRKGIALPDSTHYLINLAIDEILKREFNHYRRLSLKHPIMKEYMIDALPMAHSKMKEWQNVKTGGIKFLHLPTNFLVTGAVDDLWITPTNEIIVVDYKATAAKYSEGPTGSWLSSCERQLDVYAWLLQKNDLIVHQTAYLLFCNGNVAQKRLNSALNFQLSLLTHPINTQWVEEKLFQAKECLMLPQLPHHSPNCRLCRFTMLVEQHKL
jgi:CRISPR/Cas system-associated exonuclease Cas4 (RecB family)